MVHRSKSEIGEDNRAFTVASCTGVIAMIILLIAYQRLLTEFEIRWVGVTFGNAEFTWMDSISAAVGFSAFFGGFLTARQWIQKSASKPNI
jgi:hypothetical protein